MRVSDEEYTEGGQPGSAAAGRGKKMYYSISEVCAMTGIEPHILRYWEKEFSLLRPKKNSGGKRAYKEKDIEAIVKIKRMLEEDKYTLQGAKNKLLDERRERRTAEENASAMKRRKTDLAAGQEGAALTDLSALGSAPPPTPLISMPTDIFAEVTTREFVPADINKVSNDSGNRALILSIRDELREVLGLLEQ
jgi:DNA-binding transcriptional MerR regulator